MTDPRSYDYGAADRVADLVMKGGITSGVVYPHAVCEIARTYRLRNLGGTSAGAIAAAVAAAAERGRATGGFRKLAELPDWLGSGRNLFSLFQPQRATRRLFGVLAAPLGSRRPALAAAAALPRHYPLATLLGALPGLVLLVLSTLDGRPAHRVLAALAPLVLLLAGAAAGAATGAYRDLVRAVPATFFGLSTGMPGPRSDGPALTPWLTDLLDDLAGLAPGGAPLTFGDLAQADVNLEMVTTSLTHGRPYQLPMHRRSFFFDPAEFRRLFPERVVSWLEAHPPTGPAEPGSAQRWQLYCRLLEPLRPLPDPADLPVVVATRLSLSFPGLIGAVPLWSLDYSRAANSTAAREWRAWFAAHRGDWPRLAGLDVEEWPDRPAARHRPERCWFSDGGIVSNFPVHFFDQALPRWPTFAINLRPYRPDRPGQPDQAANVWLPPDNSAGRDEWWTRWAPDGRAGLLGFGRAILTTMQNWSDNAQVKVPGYRDRIAHVSHSRSEGGLNLTMDPQTVLALSERGRAAGEKLVARFTDADDSPLTWDNHRWVRFRSAMSLLDATLRSAVRSYREPPSGPGETAYPQLLVRGAQDPPPSYRWADAAQRDFARVAVEDVVAAVDRWDASGESFADGAPREPPRLRIMPEW